MFTNLKKNKQKKGNKNNSYCGSVQRSSLLHVKSASLLAANPSITDQNGAASSDYNAIPIYPFIKAVSGIPLQQTTNVCFFLTQKNKNNQWQVNLLYFFVCQISSRYIRGGNTTFHLFKCLYCFIEKDKNKKKIIQQDLYSASYSFKNSMQPLVFPANLVSKFTYHAAVLV